MLGKKRPPRPKSGHSGLARTSASAPASPAREDAALTIDRLAHDGRGIAQDGAGKTVFVDRALPGETVEVAVHTERKRFNEAHIKRLINQAPQRVTPPCPYFERCGGCDLQHLNVDAQRAHKRQVVRELFARQGLETGEIAALEGRGDHYRRRARLGVRVDRDDNVLLGFRAAGSHRLVSIDHCHVLVAELSDLIGPLKALLTTLASPRQVGHIELIKPAGAPVVVVRQLKPNAGDIDAWRAFGYRHGVNVALRVGREAPSLEWLGEVPALEDQLTLEVKGQASAEASSVALGFAPGDFLQVNAEVNQRMVAQVRAWLSPMFNSEKTPRILDLFAGIGNFSLPLALDGALVHAVEGSQAMVSRLTDNAARQGLNVSAEQADLSQPESIEGLLSTRDAFDAVVLDPPRDGAEAVCRALKQKRVARVAYISCDPATLARDAALLTAQGYRIRAVAVADMFPHTAHIETLVLLEDAS
ncbi:23S rRNA (uracil(1939)-C(5))-methyltransferase RlmD [Halomonas sp. HNIBRBA4712]|uniref:23S rRNA (uracil(1939)-C(5))-methyltransferase RlmD n=1 Tax=Halomonas sp. HNIBRBA4712 TaxID=3373087 RepID=UPI003744B9AF